MKVLLTTIIDNVNYGTYLQAYATVRLLQERGCEVDVLNYIRPHLNHQNIIANAKSKGIKPFIRTLLNVALDKYMKGNLKKFLASKARLTDEFTDWDAFRTTLPEYDLYLVGSDQVWNSTHNHGIDEVFFYGGINGNKKSFATSIGIESFPEKEHSRIKKLLNGFSLISVRESFGIDALASLGINDVSQVLDPTLLLSPNDWKKICSKRFIKTEPFLLVYSVEAGRDLVVIEIAKKIAKERGLKVYMISPYIKFNSKIKVDKLFSLADIDTFLSLFSQADYAVVSSFHGTAFAINFNCQFVTVSPERFSTRVNSLLQLLHLEERYVKNSTEIPDMDIDFNLVNKILENEREKGHIYLKKLISNTIPQ